MSNSPQSVIASLATPNGPAALHDATVREAFRQALLRLIDGNADVSLGAAAAVEEVASAAAAGETLPTGAGDRSEESIGGCHSSLFAEAYQGKPLTGRVGSAEQSNTSILFDQKMIMKLFRRLQGGENPDIEIGRFLTENAHFTRIAPFLGEITLKNASGPPTALAMLQELVANEGDGWKWTLEELARFYESVAGCPAPNDHGEPATFLSDGRVSAEAVEKAGLYLEAASLLGRRTAELHLALATETHDEAFRAEPLTTADLQADAGRIGVQITATLAALRSGMASLEDATADDAATILSRRVQLFAGANAIASEGSGGKRIRIHGDYHLGQVLRAKNDFVLLDFEGEPARPLEERRKKQCPLKDVAGMLRSFSYAAWAGFDQYVQRHPDRHSALEAWARLWQQSASTEFLRTYRQVAAADASLLPAPAHSDTLLNAYLLEKSLYELLYELNNRPAWVRVPLAGILALTGLGSTNAAR
jgi:maltose alpha-D-glucosyltransferase/alpha-amylase